jgi:hypothetical protein
MTMRFGNCSRCRARIHSKPVSASWRAISTAEHCGSIDTSRELLCAVAGTGAGVDFAGEPAVGVLAEELTAAAGMEADRLSSLRLVGLDAPLAAVLAMIVVVKRSSQPHSGTVVLAVELLIARRSVHRCGDTDRCTIGVGA